MVSLSASPLAGASLKSVDQETVRRMKRMYSKLPMRFEKNMGQFGGRVKFRSKGKGYSLFLTSTETILALQQQGRSKIHPRVSAPDPPGKPASEPKPPVLLHMKFKGADSSASYLGLDEMLTKSYYYSGSDPLEWQRDIPNYRRVQRKNVYPGIDMVYYGSEGGLEYDFLVAPGADPNQIRFAFEGARSMEIAPEGTLVLVTDAGEIRQEIPEIYQVVESGKHPVAGRFVRKGEFEAGFELGAYDTTRSLTIDPVLVSRIATSGDDAALAMELTSTGLVIAGEAFAELPVGRNPFDIANLVPGTSGPTDGFIAGFSPQLDQLNYYIQIGGSSTEAIRALAVDDQNGLWFTGDSASPDFPTTPDAYMQTMSGIENAFLGRIDLTNLDLSYGTRFGGDGGERSLGLALSLDSKIVYIGGTTSSFTFPATLGSTSSGGGLDGWLAGFNFDGTLQASTLLRGNGDDWITGLALDGSGNLFSTGDTDSNNLNFPGGAYQSALGGGRDMFVFKSSPDLSIQWGTYFGLGGDEFGAGIDTDGLGNAHVVGSFNSLTLPVPAGSRTQMNSGGFDAFYTRWDAGGDLTTSFGLDTPGDEFATAIRISDFGNPDNFSVDAYYGAAGISFYSNYPYHFPSRNIDSESSFKTQDSVITAFNISQNGFVLTDFPIMDTFVDGVLSRDRSAYAVLTRNSLDIHRTIDWSITNSFDLKVGLPFKVTEAFETSNSSLDFSVFGRRTGQRFNTDSDSDTLNNFLAGTRVRAVERITYNGNSDTLAALNSKTNSLNILERSNETYRLTQSIHPDIAANKFAAGLINNDQHSDFAFAGVLEGTDTPAIQVAYSIGDTYSLGSLIQLLSPVVSLEFANLPNLMDPLSLVVTTRDSQAVFFGNGNLINTNPGRIFNTGVENFFGGVGKLTQSSGNDFWTYSGHTKEMRISAWPTHAINQTLWQAFTWKRNPFLVDVQDIDGDGDDDAFFAGASGTGKYKAGVKIFPNSPGNSRAPGRTYLTFGANGGNTSGDDVYLGPLRTRIPFEPQAGEDSAKPVRQVPEPLTVYLVGSTNDDGFPTTEGAFQTLPQGGFDGYVVKATVPELGLPSLKFPRLVTKNATESEGPDSSENENGGDDSEFSGFAVANLGSTAGDVVFSAYDTSGALLSGNGITNPVSRRLNPGEQLPIVDAQLFGQNLPDLDPIGWVEVDSVLSKLVGFFLMFNSSVTILDGADVSGGSLFHFIFPEIDPEGFTNLHIANPSASSLSATIDLVKSDGTPRTTSVNRTIQGNGVLAEPLSRIFSGVNPDASDYVRVTTSRGSIPFELIGRGTQFVEGLNGQDATAGATTLYSPQYVVGGPDWRSALTIVSLEGKAGNVTFKFFADDGTQLGSTQTRAISPRGKLRITDQKFFLDAGNTLTQGYVEITSDVRITGNVVFGDQTRSRFSAALPLISTLNTDIVFSQLASNDTFFMGLAILAPEEDLSYTVEIYDAAGTLLFTVNGNLSKNQRISQLLTQYVTALAGQNVSSGYVRVKLSKGGAGFALFGRTDLDSLSAVQAQPVP